MPLISWSSNPQLSSRPDNLIFPENSAESIPKPVYRSTSCDLLNSPDDFEHFYTPRATFKQPKPEKLQIPKIFINSAKESDNGSIKSGFSSGTIIGRKVSDSNISDFTSVSAIKPPVKRHFKEFRRFDTNEPFKHKNVRDLLKSAKRRLGRISGSHDPDNFGNRRHSQGSQDDARVQFALSQTPPVSSATSQLQPPPMNNSLTHPTLSPVIQCFQKGHRGELDISEKYNYDLSKAQLKASSRTSALLAGFAMVCLVELQYDQSTSKPLLIVLGVVTSLLVSVHLLALMMSTCILPYMEATGCTQDSPHLKLKFYIDLSWLFSTCIGLLLFLVEIGVIFYVKFTAVGYPTAGYITTAMLVPVGIVFVVFSYLIHKNRVSHSLGRFKDKVDTMKQFLDVEANLQKSTLAPSTIRDI